jgi:hypothetical protein
MQNQIPQPGQLSPLASLEAQQAAQDPIFAGTCCGLLLLLCLMEQGKHGELSANLQLLQKEAPIWHGSPETPGHPLTAGLPHLKQKPPAVLKPAVNRDGAAANALPRENALPAASSAASQHVHQGG